MRILIGLLVGLAVLLPRLVDAGQAPQRQQTQTNTNLALTPCKNIKMKTVYLVRTKPVSAGSVFVGGVYRAWQQTDQSDDFDLLKPLLLRLIREGEPYHFETRTDVVCTEHVR